ncbi:hypothetical protein CCR85_08735 [Rhodothalassium salexigens]|uniref:hypothetical protein n=1 Tax=Rhodothalassium salexigens TaxID=1086 RepID=UPI001911F2CA|nr:hypothetical protein [Rhodothalassium salexigens]MBK5911572.1 hypothetical protein [Rhodothalassium salexigens]
MLSMLRRAAIRGVAALGLAGLLAGPALAVEVRLAAPDEARAILSGAYDDYFAHMSPADPAIRLLSETPVPVAALRDAYAQAARGFTVHERDLLTTLIDGERARIAKLARWLPDTVVIVGAGPVVEGGLAHTRAHAIVFPTGPQGQPVAPPKPVGAGKPAQRPQPAPGRPDAGSPPRQTGPGSADGPERAQPDAAARTEARPAATTPPQTTATAVEPTAAPGLIARRAADGTLVELFYHELFHILSRHNRAARDELYALIGFKPCGAFDLPAPYAGRRITNPDAPVNAHYLPVTVDGVPTKVLPLLYAVSRTYDPTRRRPGFAGQFRTGFMAVRHTGDRCEAVNGRDGTARLYRTDDLDDLYDRIGRNTQYTIHPEEILADNFALLMTGKRPRDAWVPEALAQWLGVPATIGAVDLLTLD